jgi:hypothetical protein
MNKLVLAMAMLGAFAIAGCEDDPHDLDFTHKGKADAGSTMNGTGGTSSDAGTDSGSSATGGSTGGGTGGAGAAGSAGGTAGGAAGSDSDAGH